MIYDLTPEEAKIIENYRFEQALCVCGHTYEFHDGGMGGFWCDGSGTHGCEWALRNPEKLCKCKEFRKASTP